MTQWFLSKKMLIELSLSRAYLDELYGK
jgi:hypothetical protein